MKHLHSYLLFLLRAMFLGTLKTSCPPLQSFSLSQRPPRVSSGFPCLLPLKKITGALRPLDRCPKSLVVYLENSTCITFYQKLKEKQMNFLAPEKDSSVLQKSPTMPRSQWSPMHWHKWHTAIVLPGLSRSLSHVLKTKGLKCSLATTEHLSEMGLGRKKWVVFLLW